MPVARRARLSAWALAALLAIAGCAHFLVPRFYDVTIPHLMPGPRRGWVLASGAAEIACALAVATPKTRRVGATLAAALFVGVFPANIQMAIDWRHGPALRAAIGFLRLPLQIPLVWWAWRVGHPGDIASREERRGKHAPLSRTQKVNVADRPVG